MIFEVCSLRFEHLIRVSLQLLHQSNCHAKRFKIREIRFVMVTPMFHFTFSMKHIDLMNMA